ncbi:hypothetical protein A1Q2_00169 [Trichosporon asahii var. asahii CBS 8904]|uniref:Uncharacterized protein n=1 Tax=Trichosporon asahii var. asahii (strain CBS 8904) TaxID=1220162 RepID=K1W9A6_TRIAC|nr:hypothetical protein A1Q2_00169 [Trichosporon asahii var. asahii CBS 8904]
MELAPPIAWPTGPAGPPPAHYSPTTRYGTVTPYLDGSPIYTSRLASAVTSPSPFSSTSAASPFSSSVSPSSSASIDSIEAASQPSASTSTAMLSMSSSAGQPPSFASTSEQLYWNATLTLNETMSCNSSRLSVSHSCCQSSSGLFVTSNAPSVQLGGQCRLPRSADGIRGWERCVRGLGVGYAKCSALNRVREDWEGTLRDRVGWKGKIKGDEEVCTDFGGVVVDDCCGEVGGEMDKKHDKREQVGEGETAPGEDAKDGGKNGEGGKPPPSGPPPPPPRVCKIPKSKRGDWDACIANHQTYSICTDTPRVSSASRRRLSLGLILLSATLSSFLQFALDA